MALAPIQRGVRVPVSIEPLALGFGNAETPIESENAPSGGSDRRR
jgi:hypothetical protein